MRIDLLLKQTGVIKRRVVANQLVSNGRILVNGKSVKPAYDVKENDIILLQLGTREITIKINYVLKGKKIIPNYIQL